MHLLCMRNEYIRYTNRHHQIKLMEASDTDKCALASMITEKGCYLSMSLIDAYHFQLFDFLLIQRVYLSTILFL